jgi:hypothetical protein
MATRGRPRIQGILRFNVASDLTLNRKFIRLRRILKMSEKDAYATLVRFWNYVAVNHALEPTIRPEDADILADYCWFEGNPGELLTALLDSGFIESDYSVRDWMSHQPLAAKVANDREYSREKSPNSGVSAPKNTLKLREDNLMPIPPTPLPTNGGQWRSGSVSPIRNRNGTVNGGDAVRSIMTGIPAPVEITLEADELCIEFCRRYGYCDPKQREALRVRILKCGELHGLDCVRRMIAEIYEDSKVREPVAVLHHKLNQALA